jgi:two-component system, NtrC family, sensor histidine kinase HydH
MFKSIVAPVVLVSLLWITFSVISTFSLNSLVESNTHSLTEDVTTIESAWALRRDTWRLQTAILNATQAASPQTRSDIAALEKEFRESLAQARSTSLTGPEIAVVNRIESRFVDYSAHIHKMFADDTMGTDGLSAAKRAELMDLALAVLDACRELTEINEGLLVAATDRNRRLYTTITWVRFGGLAVGPPAGVLCGLWMARRMRRSVSQISVKLNHASGALAEQAVSGSHPTDDLPELDHQADLIARRVDVIVGELERTRKQVIQSERLAAVGELAAGVAHEIRNPLTSVKLLIQNVAQPHSKRTLSEKQTDVLLHEVSRMESLVEDLLNFARPPRLQPARHDLRVTLGRAVNLVSSRARQQAVLVREDFPDSEVALTGDPEQLLLVFLNLLINGIEAAENGAVTIRVRADNEACHVEVHDTGKGIAPAVLHRLFEPFVTTKERGTGLGLAICRRIVHEHGGTIHAENAATGGAVFAVTLPLHSEDVTAVSADNRVRDSQTRDSRSTQTMLVSE